MHPNWTSLTAIIPLQEAVLSVNAIIRRPHYILNLGLEALVGSARPKRSRDSYVVPHMYTSYLLNSLKKIRLVH
jgi:hypothetical protein